MKGAEQLHMIQAEMEMMVTYEWTTWTTGKIGPLSFDGVDDYFDLGNSDLLKNKSFWQSQQAFGFGRT